MGQSRQRRSGIISFSNAKPNGAKKTRAMDHPRSGLKALAINTIPLVEAQANSEIETL
jgi:hypothetical protein